MAAKIYYCIQDGETGLFLRKINEWASDSEQITVPNGTLYMTKRSGLRFKSLDLVNRYLAFEFGLRIPPDIFFDGDDDDRRAALMINPSYRQWLSQSKPTSIAMLPESFRVVLVTPRSEAGPRTVVPVEGYSLARQIDYTLRRKRGLQAHGPSFLLVLQKIEEREATDVFTHALVLQPPATNFLTSDALNIKAAIKTMERGRKEIIRATSGRATTIAFQSDNDAIAFRLCYSGGYSLTLVELGEFTRSCASDLECS